MIFGTKYINGKRTCIKNGNIITEEELLNYLREFYEKHGRIPVANEFNYHSKYPSSKIYQTIFGRWNIAIKMAGLRPNRLTNPTIEELLGHLQKFYKENGRVPEENDFKNNPKYPSYITIWRYFGGLNNAIKMAGLWEKRFNSTNTCYRCIKDGKTIEESQLHNPRREKDKDGNETGEWICINHWSRDYQRYNPESQENLIKSLRYNRTNNLDPNSCQAKGNNGEELLCQWKGFTNLNKKYDKYNTRIDCIDEKTGIYYQAKTSFYDQKHLSWDASTKYIQDSILKGFRFKSLFLFCISKDGSIVVRIYEIPEKELLVKKGVYISKNPKDSSWYEKYRITDKEELKIVNNIWKNIITRAIKNLINLSDIDRKIL